MKDILLTTVCNDEYVLGAKVMLYSMKKNIKNLDRCDFKIYYIELYYFRLISPY